MKIVSWLAFGAIAGLGLQTKYSMAVFAFALVVGVLLSPQRRAFAQPWVWLGGALAFLFFLPNVIWNVQHDWPFFELMRNIRASGRDVVLGPVEYVARQVPNMTPATPPVWRVGLGWLLFSVRGRPFRPLGWAFLVTLATFVVTKGKDYYLAPAFATLFAAGGVGIEGFTEGGRRRWLRPALVAVSSGPGEAQGAPADGGAASVAPAGARSGSSGGSGTGSAPRLMRSSITERSKKDGGIRRPKRISP